MTSEQIKDNTTMFDVMSMYGIQTNHSGMCSCPFHKDKKPSMKIYKDGFKCFSCNRSGDIFRFVQDMENCSFKDAFIRLGGTYKDSSDVQHILIRKNFENKKAEKDKAEQVEMDFKKQVLSALKFLEQTIEKEEPFSDLWCYAQNSKAFLQGVWEEKYIQGKEVNEIDVYRICQQVRQRINPS